MKSTAIIFGLNYHNSKTKAELNGVLRDIYLAIDWTLKKGFNIYLHTDYVIKRTIGVTEFNLQDGLIPTQITKELSDSDNVLFFYSGHGKDGHFIINEEKISMTTLMRQIETSTNGKILTILDCCEVFLDLPPSYKNIIFAGSNRDTKAYCEAYSGLLIRNLLELFASRGNRVCANVLQHLRSNLPEEMACQLITLRKYIHGWVLPGLHFDIDERNRQLYVYKNGKRYLLLTGVNEKIFKLIMAKIEDS